MIDKITYANGSTSTLAEGREWAINSVGQGWASLVGRLFDDLISLGWNGELFQVKEKFGGLRWYTGALTQAQHDRVVQAGRESYQTCDQCGAPGKPNKFGWIMTRCVLHTDD